MFRLLETLCDATSKIDKRIIDENNHIEWNKMTAFRNKLAHDYLSEYEEEVIATIIDKKLPELKKVLLKYLDETDK